MCFSRTKKQEASFALMPLGATLLTHSHYHAESLKLVRKAFSPELLINDVKSFNLSSLQNESIARKVSSNECGCF